MPKLFPNMPQELEQYNPEDDFSELNEGKTFDKEGRYHSYDDKPSLVMFDGEHVKEIYWHSHGILYRKHNKPSYVFIDENTYLTHDSNELLSSFGELPSTVFYNPYDQSYTVSWDTESGLHREEAPAQINVSKHGECTKTWVENGKIHRGSGLPAMSDSLKDEWFVKGYRHNESGYAYRYNATKIKSYIEWDLYDIEISEDSFYAIKDFQKEKGVPLWLAFLHELKLIEDSQVDFFLKDNWHENLPLDWVLRSLGITDESFNRKLTELHPLHFPTGEKQLKALIEIAEFDRNL